MNHRKAWGEIWQYQWKGCGQEAFMGLWDNLSFYFLPLGTLVSCLWQGNLYRGRKQGRYVQTVGSQSHMVVSVLIVSAVSANAS